MDLIAMRHARVTVCKTSVITFMANVRLAVRMVILGQNAETFVRANVRRNVTRMDHVLNVLNVLSALKRQKVNALTLTHLHLMVLLLFVNINIGGRLHCCRKVYLERLFSCPGCICRSCFFPLCVVFSDIIVVKLRTRIIETK